MNERNIQHSSSCATIYHEQSGNCDRRPGGRYLWSETPQRLRQQRVTCTDYFTSATEFQLHGTVTEMYDCAVALLSDQLGVLRNSLAVMARLWLTIIRSFQFFQLFVFLNLIAFVTVSGSERSADESYTDQQTGPLFAQTRLLLGGEERAIYCSQTARSRNAVDRESWRARSPRSDGSILSSEAAV